MRIKIALLTLLLLVFSFSSGSTAATAASVKDRMAARIPTINTLKDSGTIGENSKGYLEFRSNKKQQESLVQAENGDRKKVYAAIAKKQNVPAIQVGQRRAQTIATKGKSGHWFQKPDGTWYKK